MNKSYGIQMNQCIINRRLIINYTQNLTTVMFYFQFSLLPFQLFFFHSNNIKAKFFMTFPTDYQTFASFVIFSFMI